jgi:hypothetical protein
MKEPSMKLRNAINDMVGSFQKTATSIGQVFSIGREEGFSDMEIGNMVRKEMLAANYDPRTIRRALPSSAKHIEKVREQKAFADILSTNKHENEASIHSVQKSDNDLLPANHIARDAEQKAYQLPTIERQRPVKEQSKQTMRDEEEFGLAKILKVPEDSKLLKFEIPIPKDVFWQFVEDHFGEAYNHFWINGIMNQETRKILSLAMGKRSMPQF